MYNPSVRFPRQGFTDDEIRIAALVCGELFEQKRNYFLRIYKDADNWLLGLLPAGLAGLLAILLFGLEHRRYLNLTVGLICAIGVLSTLASRVLTTKNPPLSKEVALIFGLMSGIIILFVQHLLFSGLLGAHR